MLLSICQVIGPPGDSGDIGVPVNEKVSFIASAGFWHSPGVYIQGQRIFVENQFEVGETRRTRWYRVIFQQACTVVSGTCNHEVAFRHLPASPSSSSIQQHLKALHIRVRVSSPSSFAIFQQHLTAFEGLATTRSRFLTFELTQNNNTILYDCTTSNLQINILTTYMNVNSNKMLETLIFQQSYAQHLYSIHIHKQMIKSGAALMNTTSCIKMHNYR